MTLFSLRKPLRQYCAHLSRAQRRSWLQQRARLTSKVAIGVYCIPRGVAKQFVYVTLA